MRRITLVVLAVFVVAAAAASCIASERSLPAVNAAAIASGVAFDNETLKQAVAATQAVGITNNSATRQLTVRPAPGVPQSPAPAGKTAAQAPSACPPAIDQATLKQVLLPALENAIKEIRAEMTGAQKPPVQPSAPAPAVKSAPVPKPEASGQVWPEVPACGKAEPQREVKVPAAGKSVTKPTAAANSAPRQQVESQCANCNRERVIPLPEPVPPQAAKSAPAPAVTGSNANAAPGVTGPAQQGLNIATDRNVQHVMNTLENQGLIVPGMVNAHSQAVAPGQTPWGQTPASAAGPAPAGGVHPNVSR